jgi:hypothetical protein
VKAVLFPSPSGAGRAIRIVRRLESIAARRVEQTLLREQTVSGEVENWVLYLSGALIMMFKRGLEYEEPSSHLERRHL